MSKRAAHDAPYWCEENVWHLLDDPRLGSEHRAAWILTNARRQVKLWGQRAARPAGAAVVWDYHVLAASRADDSWWIWDLDTTFEFPMRAGEYIAATFAGVETELRPRVRVVDGGSYRAGFSSDRSHMRDAAGRYQQRPPSWPPIGEGNALRRLLDPDDTLFGPWLDFDEVARRYGSLNRP